MTILTTKVSQDGSIVLPLEIRQKLGIEVGDEVILVSQRPLLSTS